jgi:hypothetical protein
MLSLAPLAERRAHGVVVGHGRIGIRSLIVWSRTMTSLVMESMRAGPALTAATMRKSRGGAGLCCPSGRRAGFFLRWCLALLVTIGAPGRVEGERMFPKLVFPRRFPSEGVEFGGHVRGLGRTDPLEDFQRLAQPVLRLGGAAGG